MAVNKVIVNNDVLIDLTSDTVTSDSMVLGTKAHDKSGNIITGTLQITTIYEGTGEPSSTLGVNGDLYFKV